MREKLIDIVEAYADFLDWDTKEDMVDSIMELLATDNNVGHKWIPVTERLPDDKDSFLVATDDGVVGEAFLWEGFFYWQEGACDLYANPLGKDVTHWMPLPDPPKGE